jgi:hypothetical protein
VGLFSGNLVQTTGGQLPHQAIRRFISLVTPVTLTHVVPEQTTVPTTAVARVQTIVLQVLHVALQTTAPQTHVARGQTIAPIAHHAVRTLHAIIVTQVGLVLAVERVLDTLPLTNKQYITMLGTLTTLVLIVTVVLVQTTAPVMHVAPVQTTQVHITLVVLVQITAPQVDAALDQTTVPQTPVVLKQQTTALNGTGF